MCLECFSKWCQHQMNARKFRNFGEDGYSVGCPGPGVCVCVCVCVHTRVCM